MKIMNIFLILIFFISISANIWDNIYSQAKSPRLVIPKEFQLTLRSENSDSTIGEIFLSSEENLIKLSLVLDESDSKDEFIHIIFNFNEGKVYFDTQEKCVYQYYEMIEQLSVDFFLNAYDLLTYFSEDNDNFNYTLVNPLEISVADDKINKIPSLISNILKNVNNLVKSNNIYDSEYYGNFIIDKTTLKIKAIAIKTGELVTRVTTDYKPGAFDKGKFNAIHNLTECIEYKN
jgi:hypothetical protein